MHERSWRRGAAPGLWVLVAVLAVPGLAQAQLFPNANINRKRVPCCQEAPVYGMYRERFYGHYPTCWRRFPAGWGCPTPEAPPPWDVVQRDAPIRLERDVEVPTLDTSLPAGGGGGLPGNLPAGSLPLPDAGSPFETPDPAREPARDQNLNLPDLDAPGLDAPAPPAGNDSPFDQVLQPPAAPGPGASNGLEYPALDPPNAGVEMSPPPMPSPPIQPMQPRPASVGHVAPPPPNDHDVARQEYRAPRRSILAGILNRVGILRR